VLAADETADLEADPLATDAPVLAQLSAAAVRGRSAFGDRAGTPVLRVGRTPDAPWVWTVGPRRAHLERFDLHADRAVRADDRAGLERLVRYLLRPPLAQERLTRLADGRVVCTLGRPWHDGTRHLIFTPHEFLERLAAITPRPRINLLIYRGVLAPRSHWRPPRSDDPAVIAPPVPPSASVVSMPIGGRVTRRKGAAYANPVRYIRHACCVTARWFRRAESCDEWQLLACFSPESY